MKAFFNVGPNSGFNGFNIGKVAIALCAVVFYQSANAVSPESSKPFKFKDIVGSYTVSSEFVSRKMTIEDDGNGDNIGLVTLYEEDSRGNPITCEGKVTYDETNEIIASEVKCRKGRKSTNFKQIVYLQDVKSIDGKFEAPVYSSYLGETESMVFEREAPSEKR